MVLSCCWSLPGDRWRWRAVIFYATQPSAHGEGGINIYRAVFFDDMEQAIGPVKAGYRIHITQLVGPGFVIVTNEFLKLAQDSQPFQMNPLHQISRLLKNQ